MKPESKLNPLWLLWGHLLLASCHSIPNQPTDIRLSGRVIDAQSGQPLAGVRVEVFAHGFHSRLATKPFEFSRDTTITDSSGRYTIHFMETAPPEGLKAYELCFNLLELRRPLRQYYAHIQTVSLDGITSGTEKRMGDTSLQIASDSLSGPLLVSPIRQP